MSTKFRFQSLLQLREQERDEAGAAVSQALQAIARIEDKQAEVLQEKQRVREAAQSRRVGSLAVERLLADGRYEMQLEFDYRELTNTRQQLMQALAVRQERLELAQAEVKRFEILKELHLEQRRALETRQFQAMIDEAASMQVYRAGVKLDESGTDR